MARFGTYNHFDIWADPGNVQCQNEMFTAFTVNSRSLLSKFVDVSTATHCM